jgi:hypothetical protein
MVADMRNGQHAREDRVAGVQEPVHQIDPVRFAEVIVGAGGRVLGSLERDYPGERLLVEDIGVEPNRASAFATHTRASAILPFATAEVAPGN